jgi:phage gpG-like protein
VAGFFRGIASNVGSAIASLASAAKRLVTGGREELKPDFGVAAARYLAFIRQRFISASRGDGTWQPLALSTRIAKLRKIAPARLRQFMQATPGRTRGEQLANLAASRPMPILRDTNTLFASLTQGAANNTLAFEADGVTVGTAVKYAPYHQYGGTIPGRPPQRTIFVPPDPVTQAEIGKALAGGVLRVYTAALQQPNGPAVTVSGGG